MNQSPESNATEAQVSSDSDKQSSQVESLQREVAMLHIRVERLEHECAAMKGLVTQVKRLKIWDFTPYRLVPDESWVALDRAGASELLAALAGVDHWDPWHTRIESRPPS